MVTSPRTTRPVALSALALSAALLSGCVSDPGPTPSPTAAFASEEEAFAAAEETYRAYIDAFNAVDLQDPHTFEPLFDASTGEYQRSEREQLSEMHANRYVQHGVMVTEWFRGVSASDDGAIHARACNDVSQSFVSDADGNPITSPERPDRYALDLEFVVKDGMVKLSRSEAVEDPECA